MGRSSKSDAQRFSQTVCDPYCNVIDTGHFEKKNGRHYGVSNMNFSDPDKFEVCYMHGIASAIVSDDKMLNRAEDDENRDIVYYKSQHKTEGYTGTKLNKDLRSNMPLGTPPEIAEQYTIKSCRKGSITKCVATKHVDEVHVSARGGHNIGSAIHRDILILREPD